ncbi:alpha/beta fold hydrolase [Erythrobacter sp. HL-111]|uniref:alpha/beta fold hydrolase n=1 Tax=Erythrobacter sp. HL-111 TaxID=1798193 RepID=UPI0006DB78F5|nr:alpha/beta hydrolase [Erythrobacter sp. HL-111]KPP93347.1 MAG: putative hydrolases or acyltransferases (alpha/beta hydrolase superfamily) [Erythrobacteraceae bacterium HL-111]SDR72379.1 Pimeloyl-ACP methyl ester carboxylesterase [Erythrobacter sp. HL-111]
MAASYDDCSWTSPDGLTLHYRDYPGPEGGTRTPVLCLHGLTRNARDFADLAQHIAQTRRVIVPDMRGRGMSDYAPDPETYNPLTYVADVEKLLAERGLTRFVSIGTSMGGLMTMLLAQADADRIAAVVLNDIGPVIEPAGLERISGYVGQGRSYPTWIHAARSLCEVHGEAFPDYTLEDWLDMAKRIMVVSQNGRISYDYDMAIAEPFAKPGNAAPADLWSAFETLAGKPMLLVIGELSDLISPATVERMRELNPRLETVTVPRVGHAPTLDEPEARAAIDALLAGVE